MGYYIRVLGIEDRDIQPDELSAALKGAGFAARLESDRDEWTMIEVTCPRGSMLAQIERNYRVPGGLAQEELDEFRELIRVHQPLSAVNWLDKYFNQVKLVYAFRVLDAAMADDNFEIVSALRTAIWSRAGGLMQHDLEGFTNDEGYHILWQFPDTISGDKYCAVLDNGGWVKFRMDLGDAFQRMAFWAGEVPQMAVRL